MKNILIYSLLTYFIANAPANSQMIDLFNDDSPQENTVNASEEEKTMRLLWAGAIVNRIIIYLKEGAIDNVNDLAKDCFKYLSKFSLSIK